MIYESKNHSKYLLLYHVILVIKFRKKIIWYINDELKQIITDISKESNFEILEMETDEDHIHLLIKSEPKYSILSIVRRIKQESTIRIWKTQASYLSTFFWKEHTLWSDGYFASTIGNISKEKVEEYIRNQG